jgi:hypothetical protein
MKRKTTISLTIAALLSLSGMVYAATHTFFSFIVGSQSAGPISVAASIDSLFATQFCDPELLSISCTGIPTPITTIPGFPSGQCLERYMAVSPAVSANAGFAPRDVYITQGNQIFQFRPPAGPILPFTTIPACGDDHTGITFDHVGSFGNKMIISCENGTIWTVNGVGTTALVGTLPINIENEGPAVAPSPGFGPFGGQILVTNDNDAVNAIRNDGFVTLNAFFIGAGTGPEDVQVIPDTLCQYCGTNGTFFQAIEAGGFGSFPGLYEYFPIDFSSFPGDILVPCEGNSQIVRIHFNGSSYDMFFFDIITGGLIEGSNFVDCNIPSPTPTPTATSTSTPTSTPTNTPTSTPTNTPTSTATFTPTSTATFTPTSTATFTPTATATFTPTPTPSATSTPTPTPTNTPCGALGLCTAPYPFTSGNPRTSVAFNESEVLAAFRVTTTEDGCTPLTLNMFYSDEHALTLGVRQTQVKTCAGITVTGVCTVSAMVNHPADHVHSPMTGCTEAAGGVDPSGRPMAPVVFITDLDTFPGSSNPLAGDWQFGGTGIPPDDVFGTWKAAVSTLDQTVSPNVITVTPDPDPAPNTWNLDGAPPCPGPNCPDPVPTPTPTNQGYGAECRWNISTLGLIPGHHYRLYFIVHDGDQNKTGGDSGQACVFLTMPGSSPTPSPTPTASPTPTPTATPFALPAGMIVGTKTLSGKNIKVSFFNNTGAPQRLTGLSMSWPQPTNGNLTKITMGGTTIYSTPTASPLSASSLLGTDAQRTIAAGACATLTFTFVNNVDTIPADYTGSAHFTPFGDVTFFP